MVKKLNFQSNQKKGNYKFDPNKKKRLVEQAQNDADEDVEVKEGRVIEALPAALFRVKFDDDSGTLICFLKGKIKVFKIKILVGDKVLVELDPYGGKGRIVRRF